MRDIVIWYLGITILGIGCLPIIRLAFRNLPDQGWSLARAGAILLLGFACWFPLIVIPALPYSRAWIFGTAFILIAGNGIIVWRFPAMWQGLVTFIQKRWAYIAFHEGIFIGVLWLLGWLRTFNPQVEGTEKFMDQAFLSSIIHAQHLPPPDPWLSGFSINYYYFGHFLLGTLAKLFDTPSSIAFNVGIAVIAALAASTIFGIASNMSAVVIAAYRSAQESTTTLAERAQIRLSQAVPFGIFAVIAALILGNLQSFSIWRYSLSTTHITAWDWLRQPKLWADYDWWYPTRAIPSTITEFPNFSFQLADLHAHVLALPFTAMALAVAFNIWLAPQRQGLAIFGQTWVERVPMAGMAGITIGALYAMNGWDLPTYLGIVMVAILLHQWLSHNRTFGGDFGIHILQLGGLLVALCFIPFLPFYFNFNSPSQGIGIVTGTVSHTVIGFLNTDKGAGVPLGTRTAIGDEIAVNGTMFLIIGSWLMILLARQISNFLQQHTLQAVWDEVVGYRPGNATGTGTASLVSSEGGQGNIGTVQMSATVPLTQGSAWVFAWGMVLVTLAFSIAVTIATPHWEGWTFTWALIISVATLGLIVNAIWPCMTTAAEDDMNRATLFPLLLILVSFALIGACEVVFLKDVFAGSLPRMNTVFKLYFQVWLLFAVVAAPTLTWLWLHVTEKLPGKVLSLWQPVAYIWRGAWALLVVAVIATTLIYPIATAHVRYLSGQPSTGSLDGLTTINYELTPSDIKAITWLRTTIQGSPIILEAASDKSEYSTNYARVSTFSGLPTVLGWGGHEVQWRINWLTGDNANILSQRMIDIQTIYISQNQVQVMSLLHAYNVRYLYVGPVELQTYGGADLTRFAQFLPTVYNTDGISIYRIP